MLARVCTVASTRLPPQLSATPATLKPRLAARLLRRISDGSEPNRARVLQMRLCQARRHSPMGGIVWLRAAYRRLLLARAFTPTKTSTPRASVFFLGGAVLLILFFPPSLNPRFQPDSSQCFPCEHSPALCPGNACARRRVLPPPGRCRYGTDSHVLARPIANDRTTGPALLLERPCRQVRGNQGLQGTTFPAQSTWPPSARGG